MILKARLFWLSASGLLFLCAFKFWWDQRIFYRTATSLPSINHIFGRPVVDKKAQIKFWRALEFMLSSNGPEIGRPNQDGSQPNIFFNANEIHSFPELIEMNEDQIFSMRYGHGSYVKAVKVHELNLVYNKGTKGIACTAGGSYLPLVAVTLRILKLLGSTLPMEVFLESGEEYESYACDELFPSLNARCVILSEILNTVPHPVQIGHYQLKLFALLFSSFEEVLFLDADSFPVHDPRKLFDAEPFTSMGMVLWPDFWYATPSRHLAGITDWKMPANSLRAATESGEILLNKRTHRNTLLMAAYYNYWGPEHYYPLLAQGGPGEGDKETYLPSAEVAGDSVYQVSERIRAIGHKHDDGGIGGSAMVQFDPVEDFRLTTQGLWRTKDDTIGPTPRPFFVHVNWPKFNPGRIYDDWGLLHWENGSVRRAWIDSPSTMALFEMDVERMFWKEAKWVACNMEDRFRDWFGQEEVCRKAMRHWEALFGDST
ncbi:hypothetical protein MMC10_009502 [Thelotrema lepadinum]|nr:hypothetical protein [Thelotrema lepadinum]